MRWGALLVGCVVAACGGTGVDIEITAPAGVTVDRVELWVAYDACYDCPNGVAWTQDERANGDIYFLRDEGLIRAEPRGDAFVLHLDAAVGNSDPPWIAIVGYDKDKATAVRVLRDLHIPTSKVVVWKVDLHPATPASTDVDTPPADAAGDAIDHRAHVWNRAPTPALPEPTGCLVYQKWDGSEWKTEYFVPKSDPDCDGIPPEKECSDFWYQYKPFGRCVTDAGTSLPGACVVGNSPCADGVTSDTTCREDTSKSLLCLPDAACQCANEIPADTCVPGKIEEAIAADALFHYHCGFDASAENAPCQNQKVTLRAPMLQATCASPLMHYLDEPFTNPQNALVFGTAPNQAKFSAHATTELCVFDISWDAGTVTAFSDPVTFLLEVPYTNGTRALYPVQIMPTNQTITCTLPPPVHECLPAGPIDDGVAACATF